MNQRLESASIGAVAVVTDGTIAPRAGQTSTALPEAQRKSIETVQHEEGVAAVEWKRGSQGTQPK
jgi:hypothetical protein